MNYEMQENNYELVPLIEDVGIKAHITRALSQNKSRFHWHREMEFMLMVSGSVVIHTDQESYELQQDDILVINSNEPHCLQKTDQIGDVLILQIPLSFCRAYFPELPSYLFQNRHIREKDRPQIYHKIFKRIAGIIGGLEEKENGYQLKVIGQVNMLLYELVRELEYVRITEEQMRSNKANQKRINEIVTTIHENFTYKLTLGELAQKVGLDMYYLSHFIKKYLGLSFQQYVNKLRLHKVAYLLANKDMKKIDLCMESGFSDYRYIRKAFLEEFGCTPEQFREMHKNGFADNEYDYSSFGDQYVVLGEEESFRVFQKYAAEKYGSG